MLCKLPKVTQLAGGQVRIWPQICLTSESTILLFMLDHLSTTFYYYIHVCDGRQNIGELNLHKNRAEMYIRFDNRTVFLPGPRILKRVTQGHHSHNPHSSTVTL